ncbi:hypothetical protein CLV36_11240 [Laceyella sediminis]|uniref:Uncharacterized protein n=1 Tax=Laceyella sediminis TaxID=573074 RepID=A0ABX5EL37_9BACL|nr:hypothetical protein [Laceyella sediminis]PRZ12644.1 hypothetical protein CLV36_11240 [Laceyella sediminis]
MKKRWYQAFLDGYKPAVLELNTLQTYSQLKEYPHITHVLPHEPRSCLFFQNDTLMNDFKNRMDGVQAYSGAYHYHLGIALGFPERSVQYYAHMREIEELVGEYPIDEVENGVGVVWAGFYFSSHKAFVVDEINWLWKTYTHKEAVKHPLYLTDKKTDKTLEIRYGDFDSVKDFAKTHLVPAHI